jgi:hypothetical protein
MVIITFTRKRNIKGLKEPILFRKMIQLSSEVKYLGLTWKKQMDTVINKTYKAFWTCRGTFGKTWGLKPKVIHILDIHCSCETHSYLCCHCMVAQS